MMNIFQKQVSNIFRKIHSTFLRFPIPLLFSLVFCLMSVNHWFDGDLYRKVLAISFCGFFWFVSLQLLWESLALKKLNYYFSGFIIYIALAFQLYSANQVSIPFMFLGSSVFLSIFIAAFLINRSNCMQIWQFNFEVWTHIIFTILSAIVLFCGLSAIYSSLDFLFGIRINNLYFNTWLVITTFISPVIALSGIPRNFDSVEFKLPKTIEVIMVYIILPLILVYTIILYCYTAKIIFYWALPNGAVAKLVAGYGFAGIFTYLASYPLHSNQMLINFFARYFFKLLIIPTGLFIVTIGIRVKEYGITESRYALILFALWYLVSISISLIKSNKMAPKHIYLTLVAVLLAAVIGPWSAVSVSGQSQLGRLKTILENQKLLFKDQIITNKKQFTLKERIELSSLFDYFTNTNKTDLLKPWFSSLNNAYLNNKQSRYSANLIMQDLGAEYVEQYYRTNDEDTYFYYNNKHYNKLTINITGYDYYLDVDAYILDQKASFDLADENHTIKLTAEYKADTETLIVIIDQQKIFKFKLHKFIKQLSRQGVSSIKSNSENYFIEKESNDFKVKLSIKSLSGSYNEETQKTAVHSIHTAILLKIPKINKGL
jgi:hypothetical protein